MKKKDAIIAAQKELREKTKYLNGFAFIWEPLNGDENGWAYDAKPLQACYAAVRGTDSKYSYYDMPDGVTNKTHRMRYFIDFFNRYDGDYIENCGPAWKYIIQKSFFKPLFEKDTFKNQLANGVMFDMTKWRWRAIICACINMRFMHEYGKGKVFNLLKKNGLTERQAMYSSWFLGRFTDDFLTFPNSSGHGLIDTHSFTLASYKHYMSGKGLALEGDSSVGERDATSTSELNLNNVGPKMRIFLLSSILDIKGADNVWGEGNARRAPIKNVVSFIKQLDKK